MRFVLIIYHHDRISTAEEPPWRRRHASQIQAKTRIEARLVASQNSQTTSLENIETSFFASCVPFPPASAFEKVLSCERVNQHAVKSLSRDPMPQTLIVEEARRTLLTFGMDQRAPVLEVMYLSFADSTQR